MKSFYYILLLNTCLLFSQEQTFQLKDGTKIVGEIQSETDTTFNVITKFGTITIDKNEILKTQHQVKLNTGETFIGEIINENPETIILKTKMGELTFPNSDILNIEEILDPKEKQSGGISSFIKDSEFALGEEQLTDLFFDPTGYTLDKGTFYLSGLSFGFGVSDKLDITTKWVNYFWGDLNLRPKYKLFEKGNWEKQQSLSIGAHFHAQDSPGNRYAWKEGEMNVYEYTGEYVTSAINCGTWVDEEGSIYPKTCWRQTAEREQVTKYWGGNYKIGTNPKVEIYDAQEPDGYYPDSTDVYYSDQPYQNYNDWIYSENDKITTLEIFTAYTFSKARNNNRTSGRISHTFGLGTTFYNDVDDTKLLYRAYYGLDLDINKKMKMIGEVFYDPSFLDPWNNDSGGLFSGYYSHTELQDSPVDKEELLPIHLDFGFMYAFNESFRCGIHFQMPVVAFYWKF